MSRLARSTAAAMLALISIAPTLLAQRSAPVRRIISIGNHPRVDGVRINFRDRELELVRGANITVWTPHRGYVGGRVQGLALGLPATMAGDITGFGVGVFGVGAEENFRGIGLAGVGLGAGGSTRGIMLGGIGVGAGSDVRGIAVGGIGVGAGGDAGGAFRMTTDALKVEVVRLAMAAFSQRGCTSAPVLSGNSAPEVRSTSASPERTMTPA
jgi:hypothetical protein